MLDHVCDARIITKLDFRGAYNLIQMKEGDEYKTVCRSRYGQFKYCIIQVGLSNSPATFQAYVDDCLWALIEDLAVSYLDDILIYSTHVEEHEEHVRHVLQRHQEFGPHGNAEQCQVGVSEVRFRGFLITPNGVGMQSDRISTIEDWLTLIPVRDIEMLLGFMNFYRRFIRKYHKVTLPLKELLKKSETSCGKKLEGSAKWEWTWEAEWAFRRPKRTFTEALILYYFQLPKSIFLQTDASGFAIAGILNQYDVFGVCRPGNVYPWKCSQAEKNYDIYDWELLATVETLNQWRHYLQGANYKVLIRCDYKNLENLQISKVFSRRQARWLEIL